MITKVATSLGNAGTPHVFSPWLSAASAPPMIFGLAISELSSGATVEHALVVGVAAAIGHAVLALLQEMWRRTRAPWGHGWALRFISATALLFASSQLRMLTIVGLLALWGIPNDVPTSTRLLNSAVIIVISFLIAGAAMKTFEDYRTLRQRQLRTLVSGERALASQSLLVGELRHDILLSVEQQIRMTAESTSEALGRLASSVREGLIPPAVAALIDQTDTRWRTLSHDVWEQGQAPKEQPRVREILSLASRSGGFSPLFIPLGMLVMFQLVFSGLFPQPEALQWTFWWGLASFLVYLALSGVAKMETPPLWLYPGIMILFLVGGLLLFLLPGTTVAQQLLALITHVGTVWIIAFIGVVTSITRDQRAVLEYLSQLTDKTTLQRLATESEFSTLAREISSALHSSVRATFLAGMLRVQQALDDADTERALQEIAELQGLLEGPVPSPREGRTAQGLEEYLGTWKGLLEISSNVADVVVPDYLHEGLTQLVHNATNDAVRHGQAHSLSITLEPQANVLKVTIESDGRSYSNTARLGLGSEMLDRIAAGGWSRTARPGGGTRLIASLPLDANQWAVGPR